MLDQDHVESIGQNKIIGLVGDKRFPFKSGGKSITARKEGLTHIKNILIQLNPKKIYLTPDRGFEELVVPLLNFMEIPYVVVNPYKGYFDNVEASSKIKILVALESSKAVVTVGNKPKTVLEHENCQRESVDFIYDISDLVICIHGGGRNFKLERIQKRIDSETKLIVLNFINPIDC